MEGITQLLSSPALTGALKVADLGSTGYNLYNQYKNNQYQSKLRELSTDPAAVTKLAQGYTQPLNAGLTAAVNNQTQAQLASAGLSESPQIAQTVEAQAIAPYIQNNQQEGYNHALEALGLGGGAINPALQHQNSMSELAKAFAQLKPGGSGFNPAMLAQLLRQGTVQPTQVDSNPYEPDYSSYFQPSTVSSTPYEPDYAASMS